MEHVFVGPGLDIRSGNPSRRRSKISVNQPGFLKHFSVKVDIDHTDPSDLKLKLKTPWADTVLLFARRGRGGLGIKAEFDPNAAAHLGEGAAPFLGRFKPESKVAFLNETRSVAGEWELIVEDVVAGDGGRLNSWQLILDVVESQFSIEVEFKGGLTTAQKKVFERAAARWSEIVVGDLPDAVLPNGRKVDDVLIFAEGEEIDGPGSILGHAGPTHTRWDSNIPIAGSMGFDTADLASMEAQGILDDVIIHEMGHVIGIGTIWRIKGFVEGAGTSNPLFIGQRAMEEYAKLLHQSGAVKVPLANTGSAGTRESHWRESTFNEEAMTGYVDQNNPISRLTIASLSDLGYKVDLNAADAYALLMGLVAGQNKPIGRQCCPARFEPIRVPNT